MSDTVIKTTRLNLRKFTKDDVDAVYGIISDPVTMSHYPKPYDYRGAERWISWSIENYEKYGFGWWAMELCDTGEFIGDCGITMQNIDGELLPELGYHINKKFWRRGYGKEASLAVIDYIFTNTDLDTIYSYMTADNVASYALAASVGMKKKKEFIDGHYGNTFVYAITKDEWQKQRLKGE